MQNIQNIKQTDFLPIVFSKPIPMDLTDNLIKYCTTNLKSIDLCENYSAERGFELSCKNYEERKLVSPQTTKQLRFVRMDNNIVALRYKDSVISWSNNEVEKLRYFIEDFISNKN